MLNITLFVSNFLKVCKEFSECNDDSHFESYFFQFGVRICNQLTHPDSFFGKISIFIFILKRQCTTTVICVIELTLINNLCLLLNK